MTTPDLSVVVAVWDHHVELLPRCLRALDAEAVPLKLIVVNNASSVPIDAPPNAERVSLTARRSIGAARNAGLERVRSPFVLFADADDEIAPGSLPRSLNLLRRSPHAPGVLGRSIVDERGQRTRRGRTPSRQFRLACQHVPSVAPLLWLAAFRCSITTTVYAPRPSAMPTASPTLTTAKTGRSPLASPDAAGSSASTTQSGSITGTPTPPA